MFHILKNLTILNNKSRILNKQSFRMGLFLFSSKYIVFQIKSFEILGVWYLKFEELGIWYPKFRAHGVWSTYYRYPEFEVLYIQNVKIFWKACFFSFSATTLKVITPQYFDSQTHGKYDILSAVIGALKFLILTIILFWSE